MRIVDNDSVLDKVNFFHILKKLEPIGLLITISFAIAALTKDPTLDNKSYEFSVIAGMFFLFSFILGIAKPYLEYQMLNKNISISRWLVLPFRLVQFCFYFFFFFGIVFLLLYSFELVKTNEIIVEILRNMLIFFVFTISIAGLISNIKNKINKKNLRFSLFDIGAFITMIFLFVFSSLHIYDIIYGNTSFTGFYLTNTLLIVGTVVFILMLSQILFMVIDTHKWENTKYKRKALIIVYALLALTLGPIIVIIIITNYADIVGYVDQLSRFLQIIFDRMLTNLSS